MDFVDLVDEQIVCGMFAWVTAGLTRPGVVAWTG